MKKLLSIVLILGICTSFGAHAHGPPGHADEIKVQNEKNFVNQAVAEYTVYTVETPGMETESQALPGSSIVIDVVVEVEGARLVSDNPVTRGSSTFSAEHWRSDRSRFRWCSSL